MFLNGLMRRNPDFIRAVVRLHQEGKIPANSYVLDLDAMSHNLDVLGAEASRLGLKVLPMTKQIGRNPAALRLMKRKGMGACVAVDMADAYAIRRARLTVGHLGHLVQVPRAEALDAAAMQPTYWTVFSEEKAKEAASAAKAQGHTQALLARIYDAADTFYSGHEGGFAAERLLEVARMLDAIPGARFAGVTTFPALLYDNDKKEVCPTHNLKTISQAAKALKQAGFGDVEVNAPGTTSSVVMEKLAEAGATQVEPGHGMTGTTPLHAINDLPELPAMLYVSEVSHFYGGRAYCFGGGLYIDPVFPEYEVTALVGRDADEALKNRMPCSIPSPAAIDYYAQLHPSGQKVSEGDTVVMGFRAQAFVTRAFVTAVSGVSSGAPEVEGVYDGFGHARCEQ